jgi:imidazolonepropionase-like amidohydrolase
MPDRTLISATRTLDVETGAWLAGRRLLVDADGVIEAVLGADATAPADARPLDLGDGWVIPGLIDCHSHLVGDLEFAGVPAVTTSAAQEAMIGVRNAGLTLRAGSRRCATWAPTAPSSTARCATRSMPAGRPARGCCVPAPT